MTRRREWPVCLARFYLPLGLNRSRNAAITDQEFHWTCEKVWMPIADAISVIESVIQYRCNIGALWISRDAPRVLNALLLDLISKFLA